MKVKVDGRIVHVRTIERANDKEIGIVFMDGTAKAYPQDEVKIIPNMKDFERHNQGERSQQ